MQQIIGVQISAALAALRMAQKELAKAANVSVPTISRMIASVELPLPCHSNNVWAVRKVLENAGIEFTFGDGVLVGPGIKITAIADRVAQAKQESKQ